MLRHRGLFEMYVSINPNTPLLDCLEDLTIADAWFIELLGPGLFAVEEPALRCCSSGCEGVRTSPRNTSQVAQGRRRKLGSLYIATKS
jgi:hypothetical protein